METQIGRITHYYGKLGVAVLELGDKLNIGDKIHVLGHTTDFTQIVQSMQIDHQQVQSVGPGMDIALKVNQRVRVGDAVFKVTEM